MGMDPDVYVRSSKCLREQVYKHPWVAEQEELCCLGSLLGLMSGRPDVSHLFTVQ